MPKTDKSLSPGIFFLSMIEFPNHSLDTAHLEGAKINKLIVGSPYFGWITLEGSFTWVNLW